MRNITPVIKQEVINKDKEKYAYEFSEGNHSLEKCLIKLWDEGFETIGCCGGHGNHESYIGFKLDDKAIQFLSNIKKENIKITFSSLIIDGIQNLHFTIKEINNDKMFDNILNTQFIINKVDKGIMTVINFISKKIDGYVNIRIWYKEKINIYIVTNNEELIDYFSNIYKKSTIVDSIKKLVSFKINTSDLYSFIK